MLHRGPRPVSSLIFAICDIFHTYCCPLVSILGAQGPAIGVKNSTNCVNQRVQGHNKFENILVSIHENTHKFLEARARGTRSGIRVHGSGVLGTELVL